MSSLPLVTCVIPIFNHEKWVCEAIESITNQDYENKRLVIVDDGSSDNSFNEAKSLMVDVQEVQQENPQVLVGKINNVNVLLSRLPQNNGPSVSRNWAIKSAWNGTKYFAFLDSDDYYEKEKISKSIRLMENSPQIGVVYSDFTTVDEKGNRFRQFKRPFSYSELLRECIINNDSVVSKLAFETCGLYRQDLRVCEDYNLWLRIGRRFMCCHIPESLVNIRVGIHSSTNKNSKEFWEDSYKKAFENLDEKPQL